MSSCVYCSMNFFFFYILRSEVRHPDEKSPVNSFISYKKIWLPSRITSQPFERDRPSDAVINLLDRISRKIFRVTCIPTHATRDSFQHTISGLDLKRATVAGKRIWDANRPEKRFNSMKSRHERVFFPLLDLFTFQRSSLEPEIEESSRNEVSRERGYRERSMVTRWRVDRPTFRIIPYRLRFPLSRKRHECDLEMT